MSKVFSFFKIKNVPQLNISLDEQRKKWLLGFLKSFCVVMIVYVGMYLIRNNFKASSGLLKDQLGFTTTELGQIGLVFSITYGIGKTIPSVLSQCYSYSRRYACWLWVSHCLTPVRRSAFSW